MKQQASKGFTLIEVIVALAIFAVLAVMSSAVINDTFNTRAHLNDQTEILHHLQLAIIRLQQDCFQMVERPIRGEEEHLFPAIVGEAKYLEFTRAGFVNPENKRPNSSLSRIGLLCLKSQLIRRTFETLDSPYRQHYTDQILLDHLKHCSFSYLSTRNEYLAEWQIMSITQNVNAPSLLPHAIQVNLDIEHLGKIQPVFIIPEGLYGGH